MMTILCSTRQIRAQVLTLLTLFSLSAFAANPSPETVAGDATERVLEVLRESRASFDKEPQHYYQAVEQVVGSVIAFDQVALGVMGKYAHRATPEQIQAFTDTFRHSLVEFYGKAMMTLDPSRLHVARVESVPDDQLGDYRAKKVRSIPVNLTVSADSKQYSLSYSMIEDAGQWKARNIIVEGINIGVQFRNQFESAMRQYRDVGKVVENWATIMNSQAQPGQGA